MVDTFDIDEVERAEREFRRQAGFREPGQPRSKPEGAAAAQEEPKKLEFFQIREGVSDGDEFIKKLRKKTISFEMLDKLLAITILPFRDRVDHALQADLKQIEALCGRVKDLEALLDEAIAEIDRLRPPI